MPFTVEDVNNISSILSQANTNWKDLTIKNPEINYIVYDLEKFRRWGLKNNEMLEDE